MKRDNKTKALREGKELKALKDSIPPPKKHHILQFRMTLDTNFDEITTVFSLLPSSWSDLCSERCWYCCKDYTAEPITTDPVPCAVDLQWKGAKNNDMYFIVDGSFCSFSCSKAWSSGLRGKVYSNLGMDPCAVTSPQKPSCDANAFLFRAWTGQRLEDYLSLPQALPRRLLKAYGGPFEYEEYFYHNNPDKDPKTVIVDRKVLPFSMLSCRQALLEEVTLQEMTRNLRSDTNVNASRTVLPPANLELNKRIQRLRARGSHLNKNVGF